MKFSENWDRNFVHADSFILPSGIRWKLRQQFVHADSFIFPSFDPFNDKCDMNICYPQLWIIFLIICAYSSLFLAWIVTVANPEPLVALIKVLNLSGAVSLFQFLYIFSPSLIDALNSLTTIAKCYFLWIWPDEICAMFVWHGLGNGQSCAWSDL